MDTVPSTDDIPTGEQPTLSTPEAGREPVLAGQAERGMLLYREVQGEPVGVEIRHVEPSEDGEQVLIVLAGAEALAYHVEAPLVVIDPRDAEAAWERLRAKRRATRQIAILRQLADLAESGLPLPSYLRIEGLLPSTDALQAAAAMLGSEAVEQESGSWRVEHTFGDGDPRYKYSEPVQLCLTHYARSEQ